jgi:acyl-[acyl-carrier-protein] desaturase
LGFKIRNFEIDPELDSRLLHELAGPAEELLNAHLEFQKENDTLWKPYELVDFGRGRDFVKDPWKPDHYLLDQGVRDAIYVNLLTEDNLPYYTHIILSKAGRDHPANAWGHQWTMEEARHSDAIRDWVLTTRAYDPAVLEAGRVSQMRKGEVPQPDTFIEMLAYTSLQELATQVAHRNTSRKLDKEHGGKRMLALVAGDEGRHYEFYSGLTAAALEIDPSTTIRAIAKQLHDFKMPGTGIPNFQELSISIARAGIYDSTQFEKSVVIPTLEKWKIDELSDLTPEGEKARDAIHRRVLALGRRASAEREMLAA